MNMKKRLLPFAILFLFFSMLYSCGGDPASKENDETTETTESETTPPEDELLTMDLNSVKNVEDWIALLAVKMNQEEFAESEKKMVEREGMTLEGQVFNNKDNRVRIVRAANPAWEADNIEYAIRYLMRDDQVVLLEEAVKGDDGFSVNRIYYGDKKLLGSSTLKGATFEEAYQMSVPGDYEPQGEDDFRLKYEEVMKRGKAFMKEVMQ